jgi:hypothetical protein
MTRPEYVLEFMRDGDFRYFIVCNGYDKDVIRQMSPTNIEDSVDRMSKFFNNTTGQYRVKLYTTNDLKRDGEPRQDPQIFEVALDGKKIGGYLQEEDDFQPMRGGAMGGFDNYSMNSAPMGGGMFGLDTYMTQTREIMELKEKIKSLEHKLELMEFMHKNDIGRLQDKHDRELKDAKDSNAMLGQGLGIIMNKMGLADE